MRVGLHTGTPLLAERRLRRSTMCTAPPASRPAGHGGQVLVSAVDGTPSSRHELTRPRRAPLQGPRPLPSASTSSADAEFASLKSLPPRQTCQFRLTPLIGREQEAPRRQVDSLPFAPIRLNHPDRPRRGRGRRGSRFSSAADALEGLPRRRRLGHRSVRHFATPELVLPTIALALR